MTQVLSIQNWHTSQGTPVYFVRMPELPMADIQVVFHAGSAHDADKFGLADLTNSLLDEGTKQLSVDEIARRFDAIGASYQVSVRRDAGSVGLRSLVGEQFLKPALDTFIQVLSEPVFSVEALERVRKLILTGLEEELQNPATLASNAFNKALYKDHPYAHSISGDVTSVNQLTQADVIDFYQRYYTSKNALVALVGDLEEAEARDIAEQLMSRLPQGEKAAVIDVASNAGAMSESIHFPSQQTTICLGQVSITSTEEDYFPLMVGNYTLGGGGMVSRLFHEVREQKGLVYGIHSGFSPLLARGPFGIKLQTRNEEAQNAIALTCEVLKKFVAEGPTDIELSAAQKNIIGGFPLELASNSSILGQIVRIGFYQFPLDYLDHYREKVAAVTQADIRTAFQKYVKLDELVQITVGQ